MTKKNGFCKICKKRGYTEWHHIISRNHAIMSGQEKLLKNADNIIELCKNWHNQTTASMVRKRLLRGNKNQNMPVIQYGRKFRTSKGRLGSYKYVDGSRVAFIAFAILEQEQA